MSEEDDVKDPPLTDEEIDQALAAPRIFAMWIAWRAKDAAKAAWQRIRRRK